MTLGETEPPTVSAGSSPMPRSTMPRTATGRPPRGESAAARARTGHRCLQPPRQGARRARPARRALEAYEQALARDATNRIAERNVERLRGCSPVATAPAARSSGDGRAEKAPAAHFIEEMGKTGHARLMNLAPPRTLAPLSPGDAIDLVAEGDQLMATLRRGRRSGWSSRASAPGCSSSWPAGNRYEAAITVIHEDEVRIIIREVFAHPANFGKVSFPGSTHRRGR